MINLHLCISGLQEVSLYTHLIVCSHHTAAKQPRIQSCNVKVNAKDMLARWFKAQKKPCSWYRLVPINFVCHPPNPPYTQSLDT